MYRRFLLVCLAGCALTRPPPPAPPRHAELGLALKQITLANGLRVVIVDDPHANEVQVTMRYRIGAGDDLEHPGIAHLVEHLMFQQVLGSQTLFAHLEDNATFFNAFTFDGTTYVSRARPDYLDKLLSIEAVRLGFRCTSISDSASGPSSSGCTCTGSRPMLRGSAHWSACIARVWSSMENAPRPTAFSSVWRAATSSRTSARTGFRYLPARVPPSAGSALGRRRSVWLGLASGH